MSIQYKDYTSKKTGKTTRKFYAAVWDAGSGKLVTGPYRNCEGPKLPSVENIPRNIVKQLKTDEANIIEAISQGKVEKKKAGIKFGKVAEMWLESSRPPAYSNNTYHIYCDFYRRYIKEGFEAQPINKIYPIHIQRFVDIIKKKYAPETVNKCINILNNIFNYAVDPLQEISSNPAAGIKRVKVPKRERSTWNEEQIQYFLGLPEVRESEYYAMFCISMLIGVRPSEVCGLKESSLKDNPKSLLFYRGLDRYGELTGMKTDGSHRPIPIPDNLYRIIRRRLLWKKEMQLADPVFASNDFLFVNLRGDPVNPNIYSRNFRKLLRQHNKSLEGMGNVPDGDMILPEISLYGCRHSFATNALAANNDPALISSIMGNSVKTLLTCYAHPNQERQLSLINDYADKTIESVS